MIANLRRWIRVRMSDCRFTGADGGGGRESDCRFKGAGVDVEGDVVVDTGMDNFE